ncbi:hypothetical protein ABI59_06840 [Acidobacteria bacterium Mor1]|nr:hypothetical protein ABI59_06840 [Acidobacteria bacterium Mor1]
MPSAARLSLVALGLMLLVPAGSAAADKRPFTIEDYYKVRNPGSISLSHDESSLVYSIRETDLPRGKAQSDLWRVPTSGGDPVRLTWTDDVSESSPAYSPDGKYISFLAKRGDQESSQIWLLPTGGGEARALTSLSTSIAMPVWSPDGKYIAFTSRVYPECTGDDACNKKRADARKGGPSTAYVSDELLYRHWDFWADGTVQHVLVVEVESGEVRDMTPGDSDAPVFTLSFAPHYDFSPDSKELCFTRNGDPTPEHAWSTNADLWVVPLAPDADGNTRAARNITAANKGWDGQPKYSPDGRFIAFRRQLRAGYEADMLRLMVYERESGAIRELTAGFDNWVEDIVWRSDSSGLFFAAPDQGNHSVYTVPLAGTAGRPGDGVQRVAEFASIDEFVPTADGTRLYVARRAVGAPKELWALSLRDRRGPRRLTRHNRELEETVDIRPAETMWVDGANGRKIHVFLIKPHGFDPSKKYPTILNVHGGPQGMWSDAFRGDWQVYPGAGYVVAFANPHGSTGYGQALTEQISGDWGGAVFEDLMKVSDALEKLDYVDADRMGAMGWSYGGYMMNWFQGHTDRFKCLADMMGLFDLRSFYYATEELWFPEWDLGGPEWKSKLYEKWSPSAHVDKWKTPMLVVTGQLDFRVPYTQGLMSHTALRRKGIPSRLVVMPEAGHWPGWYDMALYYTAHLDWFHRYLGGDPAPWSVEDFVGNRVFDKDTGERIDEE